MYLEDGLAAVRNLLNILKIEVSNILFGETTERYFVIKNVSLSAISMPVILL